MVAIRKRYRKLAEINRAASEVAASLRILAPISWPLEAEQEFLASLERGQPAPPKSNTPPWTTAPKSSS